MFFVYKGTSVYYTQQGSGKNLLFLHGWGAQSGIFSSLTERYKKNFCVTAVDFPPFGLSGELAFDYTINDYKDLICRLLKSLNIDKTFVICHSFGGRVAALIAGGQNNLIERAIFCGSAGIAKRKSIKGELKKIRYKLLKKLYGNPVKLKKYFSADYNALPQNMKNTFVNIINEDLTEHIKNIKCPCLLIWGKNDRETPLYAAKKFNKYIKGSRLEVIGGGHYCFLDDFEKFTKLSDDFLIT